ncbi:hypothetical protein V7O62_07595 [Methanolobus sp. ZRKC2]|uniref:hypothetical protein n=1 Tax=Methanolobus sp. ZRKC2 TaxID=3125783 RepID=UPI00324EAFAD
MRSTDLVKNGAKPELLFRITTDGETYRKEISLVFPKYVSADLPRYKEEYEAESKDSRQNEMKCSFIIE